MPRRRDFGLGGCAPVVPDAQNAAAQSPTALDVAVADSIVQNNGSQKSIVQNSSLKSEGFYSSSMDGPAQVQATMHAMRADMELQIAAHWAQLQKVMECHQNSLCSLLHTYEVKAKGSCFDNDPGSDPARNSRCSGSTSLLQTPCKVMGLTASMDKALQETRKTTKRKSTADCLFKEEVDDITAQFSCLKKLTTSRAFEWVSGILILLNAFLLGFETQNQAIDVWEAKLRGWQPSEADSRTAVVTGWLFSVFFLAELLLRWASDGFYGFFDTKDCGWNVFDIVIVFMGWLEKVLFIAQLDMPANISVLRVLRVIRIVRVAKIIRVMRFFRELRIMIFSILGSFKALLWVTLVFFLIFYISAMTLSMAVVGYLSSEEAGEPTPEMVKLYGNFGTLDNAMLSLYQIVSGGDSWGPYYEDLTPVPLVYRIFFIAFVTFSVFAVVNIVTGVFVDTALQSNQMETDIIVSEEIERKQEGLNELAKVFREMDRNNSGKITQAEFEKCLANERVVAYFQSMKLDASDGAKLFQIMDYDQSGEIEVGEFLGGCRKLQGTSTALDSAVMQCDLKFVRESMVKLEALLQAPMTHFAMQQALNAQRDSFQAKSGNLHQIVHSCGTPGVPYKDFPKDAHGITLS